MSEDVSGPAPGRTAVRVAALAFVTLLALSILPMGEGPGKFYLLEAIAGLAAVSLAYAGGIGRLTPAARLPALALAAWLTASIGWAPERLAAVSALLWSATLALVGLAGSRLGPAAIPALLALFLAVALPALAHGLLQYTGHAAHADWSNPLRLAGTFVNSNLYAAFAGAALLAALGLGLAPKSSPTARLIALLVAPMALASLLFTVSRGGWLAAAVGLAVLAALRLPAQRRPLAGVAFGLVALALGAAALIALERGGALGRVEARLRGAGLYSAGHRLAIYRGGLEMLRARPLGAGIGGFESAFPRYRAHSDRFVVNFAHSDFLEMLLVIGVPGTALAFLLLGRLAGACPRDRLLVPAAGAALAVLAALATQSAYDFPLRKPTLGLLAAALVGTLLGGSRPAPFAPVALVGLALAGSSAALLNGERLRLAAERDETRSAFVLAERGYRAADRWTWVGSGAIARSAGAMNAHFARMPGLGRLLVTRARGWYALACARDHGDGDSRLAAAVLAEAQDDLARARTLYREAVELEPTSGAAVWAAAEFFARHGDLASAAALQARGLDLFDDRIDPRSRPARLAELALRGDLPAETLALAPPDGSSHRGELVGAVERRGLALAARLLEARGAQRWGEAR